MTLCDARASLCLLCATRRCPGVTSRESRQQKRRGGEKRKKNIVSHTRYAYGLIETTLDTGVIGIHIEVKAAKSVRPLFRSL